MKNIVFILFPIHPITHPGIILSETHPNPQKNAPWNWHSKMTRKNKQAAKNQPQVHCTSSKIKNNHLNTRLTCVPGAHVLAPGMCKMVITCAPGACTCAPGARTWARQYSDQYRSILTNIRLIRSIQLIVINVDQIFDLPKHRQCISKFTKHMSKRIKIYFFNKTKRKSMKYHPDH